ncbi:BTB/POZ domain-containing protein [Acrasis kona]|uniref:BTB/POZ domain-containing protein n=1 Tax=Acrasis kona TaxID=1008807 RepID=A0AAW2Z1K8_9EUKA
MQFNFGTPTFNQQTPQPGSLWGLQRNENATPPTSESSSSSTSEPETTKSPTTATSSTAPLPPSFTFSLGQAQPNTETSSTGTPTGANQSPFRFEGLFGQNPFGQSQFKKAPQSTPTTQPTGFGQSGSSDSGTNFTLPTNSFTSNNPFSFASEKPAEEANQTQTNAPLFTTGFSFNYFNHQSQTKTEPTQQQKQLTNETRPSNEIATLYGDPVTSDVHLWINANKVSLVAHKSILAANSKRFKKILYQDQPNSKVIDVEDVDFLTMSALLKHMYTIGLNMSSFTYTAKDISKIFDAAIKYDLMELADECVVALATSNDSLIKSSNLCELWLWAHERSERTQILLTQCFSLFSTTSGAVLTSERFFDWTQDFLFDRFIATVNEATSSRPQNDWKEDAFLIIMKWSKNNLKQDAEVIRNFLIRLFEKRHVKWLRSIPSLSLIPELFLSMLKNDNHSMLSNDGVFLMYKTLLEFKKE